MEIIIWKYTIKQILEDNFSEFEKIYPDLVTKTIKENVNKVLSCRDPDKLWFSQYSCPKHPEHTIKVPHSCKSRFCNVCWKIQTDKWISDCHKILPNVEYHHLTLTIPKELRLILLDNRILLWSLFDWANNMLSTFFNEKKITTAFTIVLHTFWRSLNWNPHLHIIVSSWWLTKDNNWKEQFIPYKMLSKRWKVMLLHSIEKKLDEIIIDSWTPKETCNKIIDFQKYILKDLYFKKWYTNLSIEKVDMDHTIWYIWRYSKRPVISEAKILDYNKGNKTVTFEYKDHKENTNIKYTLSVLKFIKLLIQHIPEKYFHQIRHYWLVANRISKKFKNVLNRLFWKTKQILEKLNWRFRQKLYKWKDPLVCPICNSELQLSWMAFFSKKEGKVIFC